MIARCKWIGLVTLLAFMAGAAAAQEKRSVSPFIDAETFADKGRRSNEPRVIGGLRAPTGAYPWQTSISIKGKPSLLGHFCGGSHIDPSWVVTAAHCMEDVKNAKLLQVMSGSNDLSKPGKLSDVQAFYIHPGWNPLTWENDIALLKLVNPVSEITSVKLLDGEGRNALFSDEILAFASGWGATKGGGSNSDALRHVGLQVVSNMACNSKKAYDGRIKQGMLCAGFLGGGKDTCQGDSGGPLMISDQKGSYVLAGIVSWGEGCAAPEKYGVYTRVTEYTGWIRETMTKH